MDIANNFAQAAEAARPALPALWWLGPVAAVIALGFAYYFYRQVMRESEGTEQMTQIAEAVRDGASAYLSRQYRVVALVFIALFILFIIMSFLGLQNPIVPFAFLTGGFFSALCGYFGMKAATNASARTANAASSSLNGGLQIALKAGVDVGISYESDETACVGWKASVFIEYLCGSQRGGTHNG